MSIRLTWCVWIAAFALMGGCAGSTGYEYSDAGNLIDGDGDGDGDGYGDGGGNGHRDGGGNGNGNGDGGSNAGVDGGGDDDWVATDQINCGDLPGIKRGTLEKVIACVPAGMEGKTGKLRPLVIGLHGMIQTADEQRDTTEWHRLGGKYGFYTVFPQLPPAFNTQDYVLGTKFPGPWNFWADTLNSRSAHEKAINDVMDAMLAAHDIDPERVFVTGVSAGGYMSTYMVGKFPDRYAGAASFSGGAANCTSKCLDTDKTGTDLKRPAGFKVPGGAELIALNPSYWNDASKRKPRVIAFHGKLDGAVRDINLGEIRKQWIEALGIDATPDNAALGEPASLGGYEYQAFEYQGQIGVATVYMPELGHGTVVKPGSGVDEGGNDPEASKISKDCSPVKSKSCTQDWTNSGNVYGPYQAARFFGLTTK
ncbi:MAG: PHB depolymerase family esterase [Myxococcaceae bacterium]